MGALIMDDAHLAIAVAHQNNRFAADEGANVVAGIFYLAFVADIDPGVAEYPRHFQIEDRGVCIQPAMNAARLDERFEAISRRHGGSLE